MLCAVLHISNWQCVKTYHTTVSNIITSNSFIMRVKFIILSLLFTASATKAQNQTRDGCPKDEYACLDVINSSQCLEQLVIEKLAPPTKEALAKCVEYEGTVTRIPGASKVRKAGKS